MASNVKHQTGPTPPPPPPHRRRSLEESAQNIIHVADFEEIETFDSHTAITSTSGSQSDGRSQSPYTTTHRKSVSFDLSDNEYIPIYSPCEEDFSKIPKSSVKNRVSTPTPRPTTHEPPLTDNLQDLFLSQLSRTDEEKDADGYEIPIQYSKPKPQVKGILRSPSPSPSNLSSTSSLERPVRINPNQTITAAIIHTPRRDSEEIERENPFRKEFLGNRQYENIYEEIRYDDPPHNLRDIPGQEPRESVKHHAISGGKVRPQSEYYTSDSTYNEITSKIYRSNENLLEESTTDITVQKSVSKSTGSLAADRPRHRPPLPPKPPNVKHADVLQNEALKIFQSEMERGNFYEFKHDAKTNEIKRLVPEDDEVFMETQTTVKTVETKKLEPFNPGSPLPPLPGSQPRNLRRTCSKERPPESPPPPPVNLATLPTFDKLHKVEGAEGVLIMPSRMELIPQRPDYHHENSPDNILVTEQAYREILLQENEIRNIMQQDKESKSRIPVRKAPPPPSAPIPVQIEPNQAPVASEYQGPHQHHHQQQPQKISVSAIPVLSPTQIFPPTQILPVQYSHLPMPQQPGYYQAFPPPQLNLNYPPAPGYSYVVSDNHIIQPNVVTNLGLGSQCVSVPVISSYQHTHPNYHQPQNFINVMTTSMPSPNLLGTNWNYNQQLVQHQQAHPQQHQHHQQMHTVTVSPRMGTGISAADQFISASTHSLHSHSSTIAQTTDHHLNAGYAGRIASSSPNLSSLSPVSHSPISTPTPTPTPTPPPEITLIRTNSTLPHSGPDDDGDQSPTLITFGKQTSV